MTVKQYLPGFYPSVTQQAVSFLSDQASPYTCCGTLENI